MPVEAAIFFYGPLSPPYKSRHANLAFSRLQEITCPIKHANEFRLALFLSYQCYSEHFNFALSLEIIFNSTWPSNV